MLGAEMWKPSGHRLASSEPTGSTRRCTVPPPHLFLGTNRHRHHFSYVHPGNNPFSTSYVVFKPQASISSAIYLLANSH